MIAMTTLSLQSCSVSYYKHRNELLATTDYLPSSDCTISYSLAIRSSLTTNTYGTIENRKRINKMKSDYLPSIERVFQHYGCNAESESDQTKSNFHILIEESPKVSALPQEWLTGLSFGLIPSWGKRPAELTFEFTDKQKEISKKYIIDTISISHISLFPIFWLTFFTLDNNKTFEKSLSEFIEHGHEFKTQTPKA